jgi:hypothetical protein
VNSSHIIYYTREMDNFSQDIRDTVYIVNDIKTFISQKLGVLNFI